MAIEVPGFVNGVMVAAVDLSAVANQYKCVKVTASFAVNLCTVSGEKILGILQNKPLSGKSCEIATLGISKAQAGAAIAAGALLMTNASGQVITAATTGSTIIGWALEAAGGASEIISIQLAPCQGVV